VWHFVRLFFVFTFVMPQKKNNIVVIIIFSVSN